jgi:hypothetical protein
MLHDLQQAFRSAVLGPNDAALVHDVAAPRGDVAARIDIYRNTVQASLIEVLGAAFPVTHRIVGADYFTALARAFVISTPPRAPHLAAYGDVFPTFVSQRADDHHLPYLADVARLEWARGEAYFAADADALAPATLVDAGERVAELKFTLHPATRLIRSAFPIVTIWGANQPENTEVPVLDMTVGECALVSRAAMTVVTRQIAESDGIFVEKIVAGATFGDAADSALAHDSSFDLQGALALHLRHGTFTEISP